MGQGLWSPWYVGSTMKDLDKRFGKQRVIDTPVSESASTAAGLGAGLAGMRPIIVHPRMDFMLYAMDAIVNQAAKWSHMMGGQANPRLTIRAIINRGGEQGAQHSQALHSWFAHIPGLRVVMPSSPGDARDLLIASVLSDDPVLYIDDRWLYDNSEDVEEIEEKLLVNEGPKCILVGQHITVACAGYSTYLVKEAAKLLAIEKILVEIIDLRVINPINPELIIQSIKKTGVLLVVDGGWRTCGLAGEIIALAVESLEPHSFKTRPKRITLPDAPAPSSRVLEEIYYTKVQDICETIKEMIK